MVLVSHYSTVIHPSSDCISDVWSDGCNRKEKIKLPLKSKVRIFIL